MKSSRLNNAVHRRAAGFTLAELLTVIAIIAVLAAIIFPVFVQVRRKSYTTKCLSNLRQIGMAVLMYGSDNEDRLPWSGDPDDLNSGGWIGSVHEYEVAAMKPNHVVLAPYIKAKGVWSCPADIGFDKTGPWERSELVASPSSFERYGSSYYSFTSLVFEHKPIASIEATHEGRLVGGPSVIGYFFDGAGFWHSGNKGDRKDYRYNTVFLDGHAKNINRSEYERCWSMRIQ